MATVTNALFPALLHTLSGSFEIGVVMANMVSTEGAFTVHFIGLAAHIPVNVVEEAVAWGLKTGMLAEVLEAKDSYWEPGVYRVNTDVSLETKTPSRPVLVNTEQDLVAFLSNSTNVYTIKQTD